MALTTNGLNFAAYLLASGNKLALGTAADTMLTVGYRNYNDVSISTNVSGTPSDDVAYLIPSDGVLTNVRDFYFPDADDATGQSQDGWGTITHVFVVNSSRDILYVGALATPVSIAQNYRPRFSTGDFSITFTSSDT